MNYDNYIYNFTFNILQTLGPLPMYIIIFAIIYFIMIRPQMKQQKDKDKLLSSLKKGDRVITRGGIIGNIIKIKNENILEIEVNGSRIDILKSHISSLYKK